MSRAKIAGVALVVCGMTVAGVAAGTGWRRRHPAVEPTLAEEHRQDDWRNAARVVEMAARAAAEPRAGAEDPPAARDAAQAGPGSVAKNGEIRWQRNAEDAADAKSEGSVLCGGEVCSPEQFCCGPPECGHCANRLTGPHCPATCP